MSRLWKFIVQIFERYPLIQNNIGGDNTEPKEENLFKKDMGSGLEESKENKSSGRRCTEEISTIVDFLVTKDPQKLTNGFSQTKENAFKIFQYEELVYNSMFIIYNAMLKRNKISYFLIDLIF